MRPRDRSISVTLAVSPDAYRFRPPNSYHPPTLRGYTVLQICESVRSTPRRGTRRCPHRSHFRPCRESSRPGCWGRPSRDSAREQTGSRTRTRRSPASRPSDDRSTESGQRRKEPSVATIVCASVADSAEESWPIASCRRQKVEEDPNLSRSARSQ